MDNNSTKLSENNEPPTNHMFDTTHHIIRAEDESISLSFALKSLRDIHSTINQSTIQTGEAPKADELLDLSAEALDLAGLSMKSAKKKIHHEDKDNDNVDELFETVRNLALEVICARRPLLAISYGVEPAHPPPSSMPSYQEEKQQLPLIVWASSTGTSMKMALSLSDRMKSVVGNSVTCMNMKDVTMHDISRQKRVYFICSTFGSGRPPRDGEAFFSSLTSSNETDVFKGVEFAVASLGNSSFEFFAVFGQMLSHELQAKGGEEITPVSLVDRKRGKRKQKKQMVAWEKGVVNKLKKEGYKSKKNGVISTSDGGVTKMKRVFSGNRFSITSVLGR